MWALIFLLSGTIGTLVDHTVFGFIRDFICIPHYATINFSDVYIVLALCYSLLNFLV
ncbi:MAG: signal peptidase II [bacterium]